MLDYVECEKQTENALYLRIKDPRMMDPSVFSRMEHDDCALGCLVVDEASGQLMYSTQNLIPLSAFFKNYTFERQEGYLFLMSVLEKAIAVNRSKPVVLDTDYMYVSSHGDEVYFVVLPLQLEFWMFQKDDCICFVQQILDEMKCCKCYELPGYLVQFMKADQFSLPNLVNGIRDLMNIYYPKKLFRKQMTRFRARQPVHTSFYQPISASMRPIADAAGSRRLAAAPSMPMDPGSRTTVLPDAAAAPLEVPPAAAHEPMGGADERTLQELEQDVFGMAASPPSTGTHPAAPAHQPSAALGPAQSQPSVPAAPAAQEHLAASLGRQEVKEALVPARRVETGRAALPGTWSQEDALYDDDLADLLEGPFLDPFGSQPVPPSPTEPCAIQISEGMGSSQVWQPEMHSRSLLASPSASVLPAQPSVRMASGSAKETPIPTDTFTEKGRSSREPVRQPTDPRPSTPVSQQPEPAAPLGGTMPVAALMQEGGATQLLSRCEESWGTLEYQGQSYPLRFEVMTIGRHLSNDICIASPTVSSRHARIVKQAGQYVLQDLNSTNKTWVYGRPIHEDVRLLEGMELRFGDQEAIFHEPPV